MISTFRREFFWRALRWCRLPKKSLWTLMVMVWGVCYTPHERYPCDRILFRSAKTGFLVSHCLNLIWCLPYSPKPPQLPRETLWIGWIRSWGWPTPPTSAHIVTEMTHTGRKTSNLAGCAPSMSKTLWNTLCGLLSKHCTCTARGYIQS